MGERIGNIGPKYAARLADLRNWHVLTAVCLACGHKAKIPMWRLKVGRRPETRLLDVEANLRCMRCGNRSGNSVYVAVAEPEPE